MCYKVDKKKFDYGDVSGQLKQQPESHINLSKWKYLQRQKD